MKTQKIQPLETSDQSAFISTIPDSSHAEFRKSTDLDGLIGWLVGWCICPSLASIGHYGLGD